MCTEHISWLWSVKLFTSSCKSFRFSTNCQLKMQKKKRTRVNSFSSSTRSSPDVRDCDTNSIRERGIEREGGDREIIEDIHFGSAASSCITESQRLIKSPINVYCLKLLRASLSRLLSGRVAVHTRSSPARCNATNTKFTRGSISVRSERWL